MDLEEVQMANRKKAVLVIIAREQWKIGSEDGNGGFVSRSIIYRELSKIYPCTHLKELNAILGAFERRGRIEPSEKNKFVPWSRRAWRIAHKEK